LRCRSTLAAMRHCKRGPIVTVRRRGTLRERDMGDCSTGTRDQCEHRAGDCAKRKHDFTFEAKRKCGENRQGPDNRQAWKGGARCLWVERDCWTTILSSRAFHSIVKTEN